MNKHAHISLDIIAAQALCTDMGKLCKKFRRCAGLLLTLLFCFSLLQPVQGYLAPACAADMAQSARRPALQRATLPQNLSQHTSQNTHSCGASADAAVDLADSAPDEASCAVHLCCAAPAFVPAILQSSASSPVQTELVSIHDDKMLAAMPQNSLFRPPRLQSI
jgi:hypothetical protein